MQSKILIPNKVGTVVFDFDGTLADTKTFVLEALNEFAKANNLAPVSDIADMRAAILTGGWRLNYRLLFLKTILKKLVLDHLENNINDVAIQPALPGCIENLVRQGYQLGILTTNREHVVRQFLKNHRLEAYFSFIKSSEHKDKALIRLVRQQKLSINNLYYVGDQATDVMATKTIATTIAVTWGYESETLLSVPRPSHMVKSGSDLEKLLGDLKQQHLKNKTTLSQEILRADPETCSSVDEIFEKITDFPSKKDKLLFATILNQKPQIKSLAWQFMSITAYDQLFERSGEVKSEIASALGSHFKQTDNFREQLILSYFKTFVLSLSSETQSIPMLNKLMTSILDEQKRLLVLRSFVRKLHHFDHNLRKMILDYFYERSRQNFEKILLTYSNDESLITAGFSVLNEIDYMKQNNSADAGLLIKCLNTTGKMLKEPIPANCQACQALGKHLGHKHLYQRLGDMILNLVSKVCTKLSSWFPSLFGGPQQNVTTTTATLFNTSKFNPIKYQIDDLVAERLAIKPGQI